MFSINSVFLNLLTMGGILSGIITISSVNPVYSVIGLIAVFVISAIYLIILGVTFIGISYLIIYVGAIAILFIFVVMMMNTNRYLELTEVGKEYTRNLPLAGVIGIVFLSILYTVVEDIEPPVQPLLNKSETIEIIKHQPNSLGLNNISENLDNIAEDASLLPSQKTISAASDLSLNGSPFDSINFLVTNASNDADSHLNLTNGAISKSLFDNGSLLDFAANSTFENPFGLGNSVYTPWEKLIVLTSHNAPQLEAMGLTQYSYFFIWLIIAGCILLLAMVGPIILCYRAPENFNNSIKNC